MPRLIHIGIDGYGGKVLRGDIYIRADADILKSEYRKLGLVMIFALFADILNSLQRRCLMLVLALYVFERQLAVTQQLAELENNFLSLAGGYLKLGIARYILPEVEQFFPARSDGQSGLEALLFGYREVIRRARHDFALRLFRVTAV